MLEGYLPQLGRSFLLQLFLRNGLRADQNDIFLAGCTIFSFLLFAPFLEEGSLEGRTGSCESHPFQLPLLLVEVLLRLLQLAQPKHLLLGRYLLVLHWHLQVTYHLFPPILHTSLLWLSDFLVVFDFLLQGQSLLEPADVYLAECLARLNLGL